MRYFRQSDGVSFFLLSSSCAFLPSVVDINKAIDKGNKDELLTKLKAPAAELNEIDDGASAHYLSSLTKAKAAAGAPVNETPFLLLSSAYS
jgi:hypothetical protein